MTCWRVTGRESYQFVRIVDYYCCDTALGRGAGDPFILTCRSAGIGRLWGEIFEIIAVDNGFCTDCNGTPPPTIPPNQPYDCINGHCIPKATYQTPGIFASLSACESGCAKDSNCTGECVSAAEIAALQSAAANVRSKLCKYP